MADFKETLEVSRNHTCFLSYSWSWIKEDLTETDDNQLPFPPAEIEWNDDASLGEVADKIESFCDKEDKVFEALSQLRDSGRIRLTDEY